MVTPEDIEHLEEQLQRRREAAARGEPVGLIRLKAGPSQPKPPRIEFIREIKGQQVVLAIIPMELITHKPPFFASVLRIEQTRGACNTQCRVVEFADPVRVVENGIFMKAPLGKGRLRFQEDWIQFDPWLAFNGSPAARRTLKVLGVIFRSQDK